MSDLPNKDETDAPEAAPGLPDAEAGAPESAAATEPEGVADTTSEAVPENTPESVPESVPDTPAQPEPPARAATAPRPRRSLLAAFALLLAMGALVANVLLWQRLEAMKGQLARQSRETAARAEAAGEDSRQARETASNATRRMDTVEQRVADMAQWREQLQQLLRGSVHARDENVAVELEAALLAAQEQAQITGNVQPMLAALRTAERRLARNIDPELLPAARAVAQDLEAVRAAPAVDADALLTRLERLHSQVDAWPAAAEAEQADKVGETAAPQGAALPADAPWWQRALHTAGEEARALVRVSTLGDPQAGALTVGQVFSLRERLRLHLQGARLALLGHRYDAARSDLDAAAALLERWFVANSPQVQAALEELRYLHRQSHAVQLPSMQTTLRALGEAAGAGQAADAAPAASSEAADASAEDAAAADAATAPQEAASAAAPEQEEQAEQAPQAAAPASEAAGAQPAPQEEGAGAADAAAPAAEDAEKATTPPEPPASAAAPAAPDATEAVEAMETASAPEGADEGSAAAQPDVPQQQEGTP